MFQSTLPCGERRISAFCVCLYALVSIHAPVWGATAVMLNCRGTWIVSIHAPVWGATFSLWYLIAFSSSFNPRSRVGSDVDAGKAIFGLAVSIHAPVWGATHTFQPLHMPNLFQSTLPCGERQNTQSVLIWRQWFQSTLPCGERRSFSKSSSMVIPFQSTLPCGERLVLHFVLHGTVSFNPRSRVGSDCKIECLLEEYNVSIHAPVWGATGNIGARVGDKIVSIHAPVWGATVNWSSPIGGLFGFNPRSRVGSDRFRNSESADQICFNPRSRVGSDSSSRGNMAILGRFNPRSRVGSDEELTRRGYQRTCFNPRSRVGSDILTLLPPFYSRVSIHAPVWGATFHPSLCGQCNFVSIHAPVWGATIASCFTLSVSVFQSTLPCGERHGSNSVINVSNMFQSTLPCGERRIMGVPLPESIKFQSTLPCGERLKTKSPINLINIVSIHAPVWGATSGHVWIWFFQQVSIHAPVWGATACSYIN